MGMLRSMRRRIKREGLSPESRKVAKAKKMSRGLKMLPASLLPKFTEAAKAAEG